MAVEAYSLIEVMAEACRRQNADWEDIALRMTNLGLDPTNAVDIVNANFGADVLTANLNAGGGANVWYYPRETIQSWDASLIGEVSGDSNLATINRANVQVPVNTSVDSTTGKVTFSTTPKTVPTGMNNAQWLITNTSQAFNAANMGIFLGKTIDGLLYNANPDYWNSIGMSSLNPETWASITAGDDSFGAYLFNTVFGIDPNTGKTQAYMDADVAAYMAYALKMNDWFLDGSGTRPSENFVTGYQPTINDFIILDDLSAAADFLESMGTVRWEYGSKADFVTNWGPTFSGKSFIVGVRGREICCFPYSIPITIESGTLGTITNEVCSGPIINGYIQSYVAMNANGFTRFVGTSAFRISHYSGTLSSNPSYECAFMGTFVTQPEGIGTQEGATLPDTSTWSDIPSTDAYLRSAYPDAYNDAVQFDSVQPDGTVVTKTFIPVPVPDVINNDMTKPISDIDSSSQIQPDVDVDTATQTLIDTLLKILQKPKTETDTQIDTITPPFNPVDTGNGDSPVPVPVTGSASALWSVYHPSQSQVNSFGAWLWTDNIITQIQQVLQNPMDGIITLHKVFAMPVDSGTGTIVIGRLDSQVGTALVTQQYVTVDCGYVDCAEEFGNVFDYDPYTSVHLYLPFIGIVPLNVSEVMRSTLHVVYGVDVFTGACLATVEVSRDANTVNLYQYSGVASVEYPLTGATHSGLLAGLAGIAGTIVMGAATGGIGLVGAGAIASGAIQAATSKNAHASNFSGNAGAMGIKKPYLIIERPQTKLAETFPLLDGYPTNYSVRLGDCSNHVVCKTAHIHGISATQSELEQIENYLLSGVEI